LTGITKNIINKLKIMGGVRRRMKACRIQILVLILVSVGFAGTSNQTSRVPRKGTVVSGACLLGTSWAISAFAGIATASSSSAASNAYLSVIPIAGPLIFWASDKAPWSFPYVLVPIGLTAAQSIGIVLIVKGAYGTRSVCIQPTLTRRGGGLVATMKY
jgi:hypothetical protein